MKKYFFCTLFFTIVTLGHIVNCQSSVDIEAQLVIKSDTIDPLGPICFKIFLINREDRALKITRPIKLEWNSFYPGLAIRYRRLGSEKWATLQYPSIDFEWQFPSSYFINLLPNERVESNEAFYPIGCAINGLIPGERYILQLNYLPYLSINNDTITKIKSKEVTIYINNHSDAFTYLSTLKRPDFVFDALYTMVHTYTCESNNFHLRDASNAAFIIENYPKSSYVKWANLYLFLYYYQQGETIGNDSNYQNKDQVIEMLKKSTYYKDRFQELDGDDTINTLITQVDVLRLTLLENLFSPNPIPDKILFQLKLNL